MYSERLLERIRNPRNAGEVAPPALTVKAENPVCGDVLQLSVRIQGDRIEQARFKAQGCPASIACGSVVAEWLEGRSLVDATRLGEGEIEELLDGLPHGSRHAAALALDAVRLVLGRAKAWAQGEGNAHGGGP